MSIRFGRGRHTPTGLFGTFCIDGAQANLLHGGLFGSPTRLSFPVEDIQWAAPVEPTKIICVGRNYKAHAQELGNVVSTRPTIFEKAISSIIGPNEDIVLPSKWSKEIHHEAELALVIGRGGSEIPKTDVSKHIFGYLCANDVTARDIQRQDEKRFTRAKSFDTFCSLGPFIVPARDVDPRHLSISCRVNGEVRQSGNTRDMVFSVSDIVSFISSVMTLCEGDVILTGTPAGVGCITSGDRVEVEIDGIGILENPVK